MRQERGPGWKLWLGVVTSTLSLTTGLQSILADVPQWAFLGLLPPVWLATRLKVQGRTGQRLAGVALGALLFLLSLFFVADLGSGVSDQADVLQPNAWFLVLSGPTLVVASSTSSPPKPDVPPAPPALPETTAPKPRPTFTPALMGRRRCPQCAAALGASATCFNCGHGATLGPPAPPGSTGEATG